MWIHSEMCLQHGKTIQFPMFLPTNDYLLFSEVEFKNVAKTKLMMPDDFYQINNHNSKNLVLHMNIFPVYYHSGDLNTLIL